MPRLLRSVQTIPPGGFSYLQPETQQPISGPSWKVFRDRVIEHRKSNNLPIGTDLDAELQDWICRNIPDSDYHCYEQGRNPGIPATSSSSSGTGWDGSAKWRELHVYALVHRPNPQERAAWIKNWSESIPCGECKKEGKSWIKRNPLPPSATPEEFFQHTVAFHNFVNAKLGKPQLTTQEARAIWTH